MKTLVLSGAVLLASMLLTGCAQLFGVQESNAKLITFEGANQALIMPADKRAIFVRTGPTGSLVSCAEPAPDVALSTLSEAAAKLAASADALGGVANPNVSADVSSNLSTTAAELSGRDRNVLLARDFLFRLCELSANYKPGSPEYNAVSGQIKEVLLAVKDLAAAAKSDAAAKEKTASADLIRAQIEAGDYGTQLQAKIDVIVGKVSKAGKVNLDELEKLLAKVSPDVIDNVSRKTLRSRKTENDLRRALYRLGDQVVTPMWDAAKS